ncbi:MAG TPA: NACHT domain-containing protein [Polyangiaceae bacterium]|nr:NACHT domain-containing protein [Polyangiaceae bacterium]
MLGGAGTGKTTLLKSLVVGCITQKCPPELAGVVPVFVVLRDLAARGHTVDEAVVAAFAKHHYPKADGFVHAMLGEGRMLIVLDGLDEVGVVRDFVLEKIQQFCQFDQQRRTANRVLVSCREQSYRDRPLAGECPHEVRVERFSNHHMKVFLSGWPPHQGRRAFDLYGQLQHEPVVRDACRNPLFLTILAGLYLKQPNFDLPSSRNDFYDRALKELLVERPARNLIKQAFAEEKRLAVAATVFEQLTAAHVKDPEALPRVVLERHLSNVLAKDASAAGALAELVEVNGLLKRLDVDTYALAHRSVHEYLAALVAERKFEPAEVLETFAEREGLFEVVVFYCGLVRSEPQLNHVLQHFVDARDWIKAARCLLHASGAPRRDLVVSIAVGLREALGVPVVSECLELLSSLAQRREEVFAEVRREFATAIDELVGQLRRDDASALVSCLGATPDQAMHVVPALLRSGSPRWRQAALELLRDIGTEDAVAQLLRVADGDDETLSVPAALILTELMQTRQDELKAHATTFGGRGDPSLWPLEALFPGNIAMSIARALKNGPPSGHAAIELARLALRDKEGAELSAEERSQLRYWKAFRRHARLQYIWRTGGLIVGASVCLMWLTLVVAGLGLVAANQLRDRVVVLDLPSMTMSSLEFAALSNRAAEFKELVEQSYPSTPEVDSAGSPLAAPRTWLSGRTRETYEHIDTIADARRQPLDALEALEALDDAAIHALAKNGRQLELAGAAFAAEARAAREHRPMSDRWALGIGQLSVWEWLIVVWAVGGNTLVCAVFYRAHRRGEFGPHVALREWQRVGGGAFAEFGMFWVWALITSIFAWPLIVDAPALLIGIFPVMLWLLGPVAMAWLDDGLPRNPLVRQVLSSFEVAAKHVPAVTSPSSVKQPEVVGSA